MSSPWYLSEEAAREFDPTRVRELSPLVRRITAHNPSMMTGPGTNCYLVGREEVAVIDTGMDDAEHIDRLARAGEGRIRWILVTHTHPDHSPGSRRLAELTGAPVLGHPTELAGVRDESFVADAHLDDGDTVEAAELTLHAIHTPGHAADHLCYFMEPEGILFAGDQIMAGATVVIAPPDGDMRAYLRSLERLRELPLTAIAPGHGWLLERPREVIQEIIDHRLARERMIVDALREAGRARIEDLVARIYTDVPKALHPYAAESVYAHLLKLLAEGRADGEGRDGEWRLMA